MKSGAGISAEDLSAVHRFSLCLDDQPELGTDTAGNPTSNSATQHATLTCSFRCRSLGNPTLQAVAELLAFRDLA
jgi:hypothetical protein